MCGELLEQTQVLGRNIFHPRVYTKSSDIISSSTITRMVGIIQYNKPGPAALQALGKLIRVVDEVTALNPNEPAYYTVNRRYILHSHILSPLTCTKSIRIDHKCLIKG